MVDFIVLNQVNILEINKPLSVQTSYLLTALNIYKTTMKNVNCIEFFTMTVPQWTKKYIILFCKEILTLRHQTYTRG